MSDRSRILETVHLADLPAKDNGYDGPGVRVLRVDLTYVKGRGYTLYANVQDERKRDGHTMTSFMPFSGAAHRLDAEPRFNAKRLASYNPDPDIVAAVKAKALLNWETLNARIAARA